MRGRSMFTFLFACSMGWITTGCSTFSKDEPRADQKLVIDSKIQPMSRNEVIYAVKEVLFWYLPNATSASEAPKFSSS